MIAQANYTVSRKGQTSAGYAIELTPDAQTSEELTDVHFETFVVKTQDDATADRLNVGARVTVSIHAEQEEA
jgi:hypothetical protein